MLHELAHIVFYNHEMDFMKLLKEIYLFARFLGVFSVNYWK